MKKEEDETKVTTINVKVTMAMEEVRRGGEEEEEKKRKKKTKSQFLPTTIICR